MSSEAAVANRLDGVVEPEHDQGAGASTQDALESVAKRGTRGELTEGLTQCRSSELNDVAAPASGSLHGDHLS